MLTGYDALRALKGTDADRRDRFAPYDVVAVYDRDGGHRLASVVRHYNVAGAIYDEVVVAFDDDHGKAYPLRNTAVRAVFMAHLAPCDCPGCAAVTRVRN